MFKSFSLWYRASFCCLFIASSTVMGMEVINNNQQDVFVGNPNSEIDGIPLLFHAIYKDDIKEVRALIQAGANLKINVSMNTSWTNFKPVTPAEYAKYLKKKEIFELLKNYK